MAVSMVDFEAQEWRGVPESWAGKAGEGDPGVRYKAFSTFSAAVPSGQLVEYEPGHLERPHSHPEDEVLYLLSGELTLGDSVLGPGAVVVIDGGTVYGPLLSASGCRFLRLSLGARPPHPI